MELTKPIQGQVLTPEQEIAFDIELAMRNLADDERTLDKGYAHLAGLLARFEKVQGWKFLPGIDSMPKYLKSLETKHKRSAGQLWAYLEVGKWLSPIGEEKLDLMGISKAFEIVRATKQAKKAAVDPRLIEIALQPSETIASVRAAAHNVYNLDTEALTPGTYYDFGGFYMDDTEREELKEFWAIGSIIMDIPDSAPQWKRAKQCLMAAIREFNGTHAAEAFGPKELEDTHV